MHLFRKPILALLKMSSFDMTIKHHLTKNKFLLNTYNHKGYWFYGAKREQNTVSIFRKWIKSGDYVLEIGGHIGYFTTFFSSLVKDNGKVDVFEPGDNNVRYLNRNVEFHDKNLKNISVIEKGVGDTNGSLDFYIDPISGQNNSFIENYEVFFGNRAYSPESTTDPVKVTVEVVTLDSYFEGKTRLPDFVKIDVEGFEWKVIQGFANTIEKARPKLMIEIQNDSELIINYFKGINYSIFNDEGLEISDHQEYIRFCSLNMFFKPKISA